MDRPVTAKLFRNGRSQAVRLPARYRFEGADEVFVSKVGDKVVLSAKPSSWDGVKAKGSPRGLAAMVADFLRRLSVLDWFRAAAQHYGDIRVKLESAGTPIGNMDLLIAAHARSAGAVLVTNNQKHFLRVPGLKVENWA